MKKHLLKTAMLSFALIVIGCNSNDDNDQPAVPTNNAHSAVAFRTLRDNTLAEITQHFTLNASQNLVTLTSEKGVAIILNPSLFMLNGNPVNGTIDLEYVEIFDSAMMAATNKPTMGKMNNGNRAMLVSGGQFFFRATQNGQELDYGTVVQLEIPAALTEVNPDMTLWEGVAADTTNANGNQVWEEIDPDQQDNFVFMKGTNGDPAQTSYYAYFGNFGWTNVDCFYIDNRPKTTILADVPDGYDDQNSAVYLSYDGKGNGLAQLDTYTSAGLFSEHYGQIPIGLECHAIFVSEENGQFKYAIKGVTIAANEVITFTAAEMVLGTKDQLIAAIQAVQD